ncbi:MAG: DNA repair protein RecO [Acidobacteriota bacterium]|jgi:DNA repair protein RecO (recombination protein O)
MERFKTQSYLLGRYPLTESSWIVVLFTREAGLVRAVSRGARRVKSPFRGVLEHMNLIAAELHFKEAAELGRLINADLIESALDLHRDWRSAIVLMAASEVLQKGLAPHNREEETFRLVHALQEGLKNHADPRLALVYFMTWFLRLHGILPPMTACVSCGAMPRPFLYDADAGGWLCRRCRKAPGGRRAVLTPPGGALLKALLGESLENLAAEPPSPAGLNSLKDMVYLATAAFLGKPLATGPEVEKLYADPAVSR